MEQHIDLSSSSCRSTYLANRRSYYYGHQMSKCLFRPKQAIEAIGQRLGGCDEPRSAGTSYWRRQDHAGLMKWPQVLGSHLQTIK